MTAETSPPLIAILIGILIATVIACGFVQFWLLRRLRLALVDSQSDVFLSIARRAWFLDSAINYFPFTSKYRELGDPIIASIVKKVRITYSVTVLACVSLVVILSAYVGFP